MMRSTAAEAGSNIRNKVRGLEGPHYPVKSDYWPRTPALLQLRSHRHILEKSCQHRLTFVA